MSPQDHRATIDDDGNIVLPAELTRAEPARAPADAHTPMPARIPKAPARMTRNAWQVSEEDEANEKPAPQWMDMERAETEAPAIAEEKPAAVAAEPEPPAVAVIGETSRAAAEAWQEFRHQMYAVTSSALDAGARQYGATLRDGQKLRARAATDLRCTLKRLKAFLAQPVWVPSRRNQAKQYSRGALFAIDMLRFGGTFASLFVGLFVVLNYQSFWEIARANLDPLADLRAAVSDAGESDAGKPFKAPTLSLGRTDGDLMSFVPPVGPPRNLLVIPKLGLHVPIQRPATDKLLSEDWKGLEEDIQSALQHGVVHYPATAEPGQAGNFFVTGHSSYFPWAAGEYKSVFARLSALEVGDEYWVFYGGDKHRYIVQEKKEVRPADVSVLDQPINKRISTLMTCSPVGTTLRRLIIQAQEVDPTTGLAMEVGEHAKPTDLPRVRAEMLPI
jgi:LPXTG-site transpeptidase (sortase) family protein